MGSGRKRGGAASGSTRVALLEAAKDCLLEQGYANLSTRAVTDAAGVPLSQIHYHFGSRHGLVLALLEAENQRLLARQSQMYDSDQPLWKRWEQACDFLEDDLESGYVRVLQEMSAAGWSDDEVAEAVRQDLQGWFALLTGVFTELEQRTGGVGPFDPQEAATLAGAAFLGSEQLILLGFGEEALPVRRALRRVGELVRRAEERTIGGEHAGA